ncbi:MAG: MOSC domain-containing protein [Kineosporiaceae bacterium]
MSRISAVCVVHALLPDPGQDPDTTAIDKRPVEGAVAVDEHGLAGDTQVDRKHHGGTFQAVYAYADEDAAWWAEQLGREIPAGRFGENVRTTGLDVTGAVIGERWQVGRAGVGPLLEVTAPRIPCTTFQTFLDEPRWVKRFTQAGRPGAYLRVLAEGRVGQGDTVAVVHRPQHGVTIGDVFPTGDAAVMRRLSEGADADGIELSPPLRKRVRAALREERRAADGA